ncbi:MAG: choice-of-anchor B family protein, partial [Calditrichaeota bacterium]
MRLFYVIGMCLFLCGLVYAQNTNVTLQDQLNMYPGEVPWSYSDVWGYVDAQGNEYAILGATVGTSIVNVTDPTNIFEVDFIPSEGTGNGRGWKDMKTYQHYLYVATEASTTIQIIDLSPLPDSVSLVSSYNQLTSEPHNIYIDTSRALLYVIEDFNFNNPVRILSLTDPLNPVEVGNLSNGLGTDAHDVHAQGDRLYVAEGVNGTLGIFDVSNPSSPVLLQRITVPSPGYVHNVWATPDNHYLFSTEETVGKTIKVWDIHDLNDVVLVDEYIGENQFAHNVILWGDFAFISHYGSGLKILDITDPTNVVEVGSYNLYPDNSPPNVWGVYPFTQTGNVFISDMGEGLFTLDFNGTHAYRVVGEVRDSQTNTPLADAWVEIVESQQVTHSDVNGGFKLGTSLSGNITLRAVTVGYQSLELPLNAVPGETDTITVLLDPAPTGSIVGNVVDENNNPVNNAQLQLTLVSQLLSDPMIFTTTTDVNGHYSFTNLPASDSVWVDYTDLEVLKKFPHPEVHTSNILVEANNETQIDFQLNPADVLLVNDDPSGNFGDEYTTALQNAGIVPFEWFTVTDGQNIPAGRIDELNHSVVIWFTGESTSSILTQSEQDSLATILDQGGMLFLTGVNIAEDLSNQGSNFLTDYLEVSYSGNAIAAPLINPVAGSPVFDGLSPFTAPQDSRDIITPVGGGNAVEGLRYVNSTVAGVTIQKTNGARVVFTGFGWEA